MECGPNFAPENKDLFYSLCERVKIVGQIQNSCGLKQPFGSVLHNFWVHFVLPGRYTGTKFRRNNIYIFLIFRPFVSVFLEVYSLFHLHITTLSKALSLLLPIQYKGILFSFYPPLTTLLYPCDPLSTTLTCLVYQHNVHFSGSFLLSHI